MLTVADGSAPGSDHPAASIFRTLQRPKRTVRDAFPGVMTNTENLRPELLDDRIRAGFGDVWVELGPDGPDRVLGALIAILVFMLTVGERPLAAVVAAFAPDDPGTLVAFAAGVAATLAVSSRGRHRRSQIGPR